MLYCVSLTILPKMPADHVSVDESAEHELWTPYYEPYNVSGRLQTAEYPPMKSHAVSCFQNSCRLSIILNDIMLLLYSRRRAEDLEAEIRATSMRLDRWRSDTPDHLKYDPSRLPAICGPPHILTQKSGLLSVAVGCY